MSKVRVAGFGFHWTVSVPDRPDFCPSGQFPAPRRAGYDRPWSSGSITLRTFRKRFVPRPDSRFSFIRAFRRFCVSPQKRP
jgi:hypothetical protein